LIKVRLKIIRLEGVLIKVRLIGSD